MDRVAVVVPERLLPDALRLLADAGAVQLERVEETASLAEAEACALRRGAVSALVGWIPSAARASLGERLGPLGGSLVRLKRPRWAEPPTLIQGTGATHAFQPLVDTYGTVPYADVNPAALAGVAYVVMFGMMFGDVGHGALLAIAGVVLATGRPSRWSRYRRFAPFVIGAGVSSMAFGLAFGDAFGPTHLVPTLWLSPLDHATTLLAVAVAVGGGLIAVAYGMGTVNRWREGGPTRALLATSGLAGMSLYLGIASVGFGWYAHATAAVAAGAVLGAAGLVFGFVGCYVEAGGVIQAAVELFGSVVRIGTNTISFARLAAFGLTHAALSKVVWSGTEDLWRRGPALWIAACALFVVGNAIAFALEGLVAGIQALRLEYYELFSRVFTAEGRPFRPWRAGASGSPAVSSPAGSSPTALPPAASSQFSRPSVPRSPAIASSISKEVPCSPG